MARKTKKATEVAIDTSKLFVSRMTTFEVEVKNLTFVMKTLPTPVMSFISAQAMTYDNDTKQAGFDFNALVLWTCKFAIEDIKGLEAVKYDKDGNKVRDDDGNIVYEPYKFTLGVYKIMNRKFPCLPDELLDVLPYDALFEAYTKWSDMATVSDEEKEKQDFGSASEETK